MQIVLIFFLFSLIAVLFWNFFKVDQKQKKILSTQAEFIKTYSELSKELIRLFVITDFLQMQNISPILASIYQKLRILDFDKLPKDKKSHTKFIRESVKEFYESIWKDLQKNITDIEDEEEKKIYQRSLNKISEIVNLINLLDDNSSMSYIKLISDEIQKTLQKSDEENIG